MKFPKYFTEDCFKKEENEIVAAKVEALIRAMTMEEKAELCHGGINPEVPGQVGNGGYLCGVPRLGVPEIRMYDGPAGVTSIYETTGLPAEEMLASSWSRDLAFEFGRVTGSDNHMISGNCQLGAEMDMVRTTHFNRTRDMLGEDAYLTSELGIPLVKGIQSEHVMAVLKHFAGYVVAANPADSPNTEIDEQTMHELYLRPFERTIHGADAAGVMTAYNRINGPYVANAKELLDGVLRKQWGFDGLVMCDWGGNHSFTLPKGMDMEMPVGAYNSTERIMRFLENGRLSMEELDAAARHVLTALGKLGYLSLVTLDEDGNAQAQDGRTEPVRLPDLYESSAELREKNAATAQKIAEKGIVLLKNENHALPLTKEDLESDGILMVGMGAGHAICGYGQERSYGTLKYMTPPAKELAKYGNVSYEPGIEMVGNCIPAELFYTDAEGDAHGLTRYYGISETDGYRPPAMSMGGAGVEFVGVAAKDEDEEEGSLDFAPAELFSPGNDAVAMEGHETGSVCCIDEKLEFTCGPGNRTYKNGADGKAFPKGSAYTWKGYLYAPESGTYQFHFQTIGGIAIFQMDPDGNGMRDIGMVKMREGAQWPWGNLVCTPEGMEICSTRVYLEGGKRYPVMVYGKALLKEKDLQMRLAWVTPSEAEDHRQKALDAAKTAKKVIYFIHSGYFMNKGKASGALSFKEGTDLELESAQKELLCGLAENVHANGGQLIVAAYHGSAFAMGSWIDRADALLYLWMPGQSGSAALARILTGQVNPSGKLPQSFPAANGDTLITDTPEHQKVRWDGVDVPGKPRRVTATEGIFTGYRWFEKTGKQPLFPFGFGLSYTSFAYSDLRVEKMDGGVNVTFAVENTGACAGDEIAQVYIGKGVVPDYAMIAEKQLCAFTRIENLRPGEKREISLQIGKEAFLYWDIRADETERCDGTRDKWKIASGRRGIYVGASSADIRLESTVDIAGE